MKKNIVFLIGKKGYRLSRSGRFCLLFLSLAISLTIAESILGISVNFPLEKEYMRFVCLQYVRIPEEFQDNDLLWKVNPIYHPFNLRTLFFDGCHPGSKGNYLIANVIWSQLKEYNMLNK